MKFLASPTSLAAEFKRLSQSYRHFDWAVAWAGVGHDAFKSLLKYPKKVRRIVVGTHFHQTAPAFIDAVSATPAVRFRLDQDGLDGVFHPKLYVFSNNEADWEAVIGSANFTAGAFKKNVEHAILIGSDDDADGVRYSDLVDEVDRLWTKGRHFTADELAAYRLRWAKNRRILDRVAGHATNQRRSDSIYNRELLNLSWNGYLHALRARNEKWFDDRLVVLREARKIWDAQPSFAKLSLDDRKKICGTASETEFHWRLFGSMLPRRNFKALIRDQNPDLHAALDHIPLRGRVDAGHYSVFVDRLARAFATSAETLAELAVATRMLCLRRPDYFISVNSRNRARLFEGLGIEPEDVTVQSYWDTIVAPLIDTPWWQSPRPTSGADDQAIWDSRVAMIDSLFYEEHS